jgi:hypothetical protein
MNRRRCTSRLRPGVFPAAQAVCSECSQRLIVESSSLWRPLWALALSVSLCSGAALREDGYHVFPGDNIQDALQQAALNKTNKVVKVHAGEYRPRAGGQALIWFNQTHDGICLEAVGEVTLTAANPELANPDLIGYPAIVNHVVYFGDGVTSNTVLRGFRITGASHFLTDRLTEEMEPNTTLRKNLFFYSDGGGIKVFGHSYPTIQNVDLADNFASPCGAGISIQQLGSTQDPVLIENCVLRGNRAQVTGSAIDLLEGSAARIVNCLLVSNASNMGFDVVAKANGGTTFTNSGVVTIFWKSRAEFQNCTFTGNRNAVDDMSGGSTYSDCIFADNVLATGLSGSTRYELNLYAGAKVSGCLIRGALLDPRHSVSAINNALNAPPPLFDKNYVPAAPQYQHGGYRPPAVTEPPN